MLQVQSLPDVDLVVHCAGAVKDGCRVSKFRLLHSESLWIGRRSAQVDQGRCEEGPRYPLTFPVDRCSCVFHQRCYVHGECIAV